MALVKLQMVGLADAQICLGWYEEGDGTRDKIVFQFLYHMILVLYILRIPLFF